MTRYGYCVTVDEEMERAVLMGKFCQHCLCEFTSGIGARACCTTCNNERCEAGLPPHANVRAREYELNVRGHINEARKRREAKEKK